MYPHPTTMYPGNMMPPGGYNAMMNPGGMMHHLQAPPPPGAVYGPGGVRLPSRWSDDRFPATDAVPTSIPQEFFTEFEGNLLKAILLRAQLEDMKRLRDAGQIDLYYFKRRRVEDKFGPDGRRLNGMMLQYTEKIREVTFDFVSMSALTHNQAATAMSTDVVHYVYFTEEQVRERKYGALIGVRGSTHQKLEKETGCKLIIGGRGIESKGKGFIPPEDTVKDPHVKIVAPNEEYLQRAIERVELLLGDSDEALRQREEGRRMLAIKHGTYQEDTWVSSIPGQGGPPRRGGGGGQTGFVPNPTDPNVQVTPEMLDMFRELERK
eukprot:PhF_6_TR19060/c0_g1_i2/m.28015/K13095/SF1; splicing factor 1